MSAQEYYRGDHTSRPLSPPTNAPHDTSGNLDHHNATDVNELTGGVPGRVTAANFDSTPSPPPHERPLSGYSDIPGYGRNGQPTYDEEGNNPYGKNYNMANDDSKEALVPEARGRSNVYHDLGTYSHLPPHPSSFLPTFVLILERFVEYVDPNPVGQASVPLMERDNQGKFGQLMGGIRQPLEQRIQDKRNGVGRQRRPYVGE